MEKLSNDTYIVSSACVNFISKLCLVKNVCFGNGASMLDGCGIGCPTVTRHRGRQLLVVLSSSFFMSSVI